MERKRNSYADDWLPDIMIGLPDGLTVPFILAAGMSSAAASSTTIFTVGLVVTFAGAGAMGLSRYFTGRPHHTPHHVHDIGLSAEAAKTITQDHSREKSRWDEFTEQFELGLDKTDAAQARKSAFHTSLAYITGGLVSILPFFFTNSTEGLQWSASLTLLCLFIAGYFKGRTIDQNPWQEAFRITLTGALAATAAFFAARLLFQG